MAVQVRRAINCYGLEFQVVDPFATVYSRTELDPDFEHHAASQRERERCAAESLGPDYLCLLGSDDNGLCFPQVLPFPPSYSFNLLSYPFAPPSCSLSPLSHSLTLSSA